MNNNFSKHLASQLETMRESGLYKTERIIISPQGADIDVQSTDQSISVLNFCANNYLGLAGHPDVLSVAKKAIDDHGYGMASVRFICGTQDIHKNLEKRLSKFLGMDDTILYGSCFDANTGLFETLLDGNDAIISDALNHASIIDGVRLCKSKRFRYANNDMADLERCLIEAADSRFRLIVTDGVFSMDGILADLSSICDLADRYDAMVMVDDSHAVGFMGQGGRGTPEYCGVSDRIDIITGTLGKALGGASGGYTAARGPIVEYLRQRSRPYLFSNSLAPTIAATSIFVLDKIEQSSSLRENLHNNARQFRDGLSALGFDLIPGEHPIIPVMLGDAKIASEMADKLLKRGIYVVGFSFPVVPEGKARIRTQMSAAHTPQQIDQAIAAFADIGSELGIIS
jgi:glycine C-acetyltransferase